MNCVQDIAHVRRGIARQLGAKAQRARTDALLNDGFIYMDDKGEFRTVAAPWNKDIYD